MGGGGGGVRVVSSFFCRLLALLLLRVDGVMGSCAIDSGKQTFDANGGGAM